MVTNSNDKLIRNLAYSTYPISLMVTEHLSFGARVFKHFPDCCFQKHKQKTTRISSNVIKLNAPMVIGSIKSEKNNKVIGHGISMRPIPGCDCALAPVASSWLLQLASDMFCAVTSQ